MDRSFPDHPLLEVQGLTKHFPVRSGGGNKVVHAVDQVSFSIPKGGTLGIIGATGSGKSTILYLLMRLYDVGSGSIRIEGRELD